MARTDLRVAVLGGVPASLGSGGLEIQVERTSRALARRGHEVFHVAQTAERRSFDVLHVFSSGPDVAHQISHWRRCAGVPLVLSPVIVVEPGLPETRQRVAHRLPLPEFGPAARRELLRRADAVVALTAHEAALIRDLGGAGVGSVHVVPNGVDPPEDVGRPPGLPERYVALVGTVSARKRQRAVAERLATTGFAPVVLGGFDGDAAERAAFEAAVARAGGVWEGEVDAGRVAAVVAHADALVHLSRAEGQSLAVLEALAAGTPAVLSPLPANLELQHSHPRHVQLVGRVGDLPAALAALGPRPATAPAVPSWDDVAAELERIYHDVGARPGAA